jgi:hypothetical protein
MNNKAWLLGGVALAVGLLAGCKSSREAAADKFRKAGDPLNALMQYEEALRRGKVSDEFWNNYALVNIQAMKLRSSEDPTAEFLDILKDTVQSVLNQHPNPENEALFATTLYDIGMARLNMGGARAEEGGVIFLKSADALANKPGDLSGKVQQALEGLEAKALKEVQDLMASSEPTDGIVADYKLHELNIKLGKVTDAMAAAWSPVRKRNLNVYMMYDQEGLLTEVPDRRINKYALLLGIVKYTPSGTGVNIQVKVWNGASFSIPFDGKGFSLVDTEGNTYKPVSLLAAAQKKDMIPPKEESKTGGVNFKISSGAKPAYLEFTVENITTRKYLP